LKYNSQLIPPKLISYKNLPPAARRHCQYTADKYDQPLAATTITLHHHTTQQMHQLPSHTSISFQNISLFVRANWSFPIAQFGKSKIYESAGRKYRGARRSSLIFNV